MAALLRFSALTTLTSGCALASIKHSTTNGPVRGEGRALLCRVRQGVSFSGLLCTHGRVGHQLRHGDTHDYQGRVEWRGSRPWSAASCRAVAPAALANPTSAPHCSRQRTASRWPRRAAIVSGVSNPCDHRHNILMGEYWCSNGDGHWKRVGYLGGWRGREGEGHRLGLGDRHRWQAQV